MFKRLISVVTAILMVVSLVPAVFAAKPTDFPDMPKKGFWSYDALCAAVENGLLNGAGGKLLPGSNLTRAEMAAIVNRAFGAKATADVSGFKDVKKSAWFYNDIAKALRMGTFVGSGGGRMNPNDPILREQAFTVVARALKLEDGDPSVLNKFSDAGVISGWARGPIAAMVAAGYVNGSGGKLNPGNTITRQEFAQVFYNVIKKYVRTAGTFSENVTGNMIVNVPGVTLKNMKVTGDLIVGEGVDNGEITLDNVEVTGRLLVRGGGENSVIITNSSTVGSILINKTGDGGVRVRTEEGCRVEVVVVDDGRDEIILEGGMNQIDINTDTPVIIRDGNVVGLTVAAENANVTVGAGVSVMSVKISENADGAALSVDETADVDYLKGEAEKAVIKGEGRIGIADVSGNGTTFDVVGTALTVAEGVTGVVECGKPVNGGETVITGMEGHEHVWGDGVVTKEATCTEDGLKTFTCECGETKTEGIPAKGHSPSAPVKENETPATCTAAGKYDEVVYCSVCSAELSRSAKTADALGHDWDDGVTVTEATAETEGLIRYTCSRCKETRDEKI
ncbi:MAG: S-layer homology domain-containing protein, partial [Clostridia bacterium]|nr:S-layer homology domain-containing protein [Clostridia bacterium]